MVSAQHATRRHGQCVETRTLALAILRVAADRPIEEGSSILPHRRRADAQMLVVAEGFGGIRTTHLRARRLHRLGPFHLDMSILHHLLRLVLVVVHLIHARRLLFVADEARGHGRSARARHLLPFALRAVRFLHFRCRDARGGGCGCAQAGDGTGGTAIRSMGALVLLHVVHARTGLIAGGAVYVLLARVLFPVSRGVARGRKGVEAAEARGMRTGEFFLGRRFGFGGQVVVGDGRYGYGNDGGR